MISNRYVNLPREGHDVLHRADVPLADGHIRVGSCFQQALEVFWCAANWAEFGQHRRGLVRILGIWLGCRRCNGLLLLRKRSAPIVKLFPSVNNIGIVWLSNLPVALAIVAVILNWVLQNMTELLWLWRSTHWLMLLF